MSIWRNRSVGTWRKTESDEECTQDQHRNEKVEEFGDDGSQWQINLGKYTFDSILGIGVKLLVASLIAPV